jgi:acetyltransferase-like isoleucine patch superfamily enzyme
MRKILKKIFFYLSVVLALPFTAWYMISSPIIGKLQAFQGMSQLLSLLPGVTGRYLRKGFYSATLTKLSPNSTISFGTFFSSADCEIGDYVYIGPRCLIANATIGNDVMLGSNVYVLSGKATHDFSRVDIPMRLQGGGSEKVTIGEDTWVGNCAIIMANIGKKCIIGAGSVVTKDIEDYSIAVGNPAKVIRKRI